tara:strand:+ start:228 stop:482 length:255 start_codon:yes stop_codon:yes gene_type:complete
MLKIFLLVISMIASFALFKIFFKNKRNFKKNKKIIFNKENLYEWMNLTKKERVDLAKVQSKSYFQKRKTLLEEIRKEYKDISKK